MDLIQLEHFLAVADEKTFTRAAERVFRTQPALSQSIKKLEEHVGVPLFARDMNGVTLTEAGKSFSVYARDILRMRDEATRSIARLQTLKSGTLSIAAHESAELYFLPDPLLQFVQAFPEVKLDVQRARLDEIPRKVLDREVQIGFVKEEPAYQDLVSVPVHIDEMTLIASPRHPFAKRESVSVRELDSISLIVHHQCSSTEEVALQLFRRHAVRCNIIAEVWSFETIKNFVSRDAGVAIVPRITTTRELQNKSLVEIRLEQLRIPRRILMIFRRDHVPETAQRLIELIRKKCARPPAIHSGSRLMPTSQAASR